MHLTDVTSGNDVLAGVLRSRPGERIAFALHPSYRIMRSRPVLGQAFEQAPARVHASKGRLPPFFANLLPEGTLRALVAGQLGDARDLPLLAHLGEDLPGAVRIAPLTDCDHTWTETSPRGKHPRAEPALRFSLAGSQLKLSMQQDEPGLILPARGQHGDWVVKLPDPVLPHLPENEYATMIWARASGIDVPEVALVPLSSLPDLPGIASPEAASAVAVRRFDRRPDGARVHQEDLAQVLGLYPEHKRARHDYETIGTILLRTTGREGFEAFVERLVFIALSGNTAAHHKSWSLRYPDGVQARLAPAYNLVSTVVYGAPRVADCLALPLAGSRRFEDVSLGSLELLARVAGHDDPPRITDLVCRTVERIKDAWLTEGGTLPLAEATRQQARYTIERHWRRVPLARI